MTDYILSDEEKQLLLKISASMGRDDDGDTISFYVNSNENIVKVVKYGVMDV